MAKWFIFIAAATALLILTCNSANCNQNIINGNAKFAQEFYGVLKQFVKPGSNFAFSPFSLSTGIGLLSIGARGHTSLEIQRSMHFPSNQSDLLNGFQNLLVSMNSSCLKVANGIFNNASYADWDEGYMEKARVNFNGDAQLLDFSKPVESSRAINEFIDQATKGAIKDVMPPSDINANKTKMLLISTIYFKRKWKTPFPAALTRKLKFHVSSKEVTKVDMMNNLEKYLLYGELTELDAKVLALPFKGQRFSLVIILPNSIDGLSDLENKLDLIDLAKIQTKLKFVKVNLQIPKFRIDFTIHLNEPLKQLGLESIFDKNKADLSAFSKGPIQPDERLYLFNIIQQGFLRIDEQGGEAAAVTKYMLVRRLSKQKEPEVFIADHPFIVALQHSINNIATTLFLGRVINPNKR